MKTKTKASTFPFQFIVGKFYLSLYTLGLFGFLTDSIRYVQIYIHIHFLLIIIMLIIITIIMTIMVVALNTDGG